jgi:peptidoglycan-N-acetylglucosamine deacetylase
VNDPLLGGAPGDRDEIVASSQVVLDGDLSKERLISLVGLQREEDSLDYKSSYDLTGRRVTKDKLSMVADVVAMANTIASVAKELLRMNTIYHDQKEAQVEKRLGPEQTTGRHHEERRILQTVRCASRVSPWAALTFDDGPDPSWTPRILDALDRAGARATFFVIAPLALEHRQLVSVMLDAGHEVEFHCTEHERHTRRSRHEVEADTHEGLQALRSLGIEPRLWRPPWGIRAPWTQEVAEDSNLRLAPWSADTKDWRGDAAPEMLGRIEPLLGPGCVVLMHDGLGPGARRTGCKETITLVEPLVARLRELGCEPTPLGVAIGDRRVRA